MPKFTKENATNYKRGKEHSWSRISFWIERINKNWDKLTPNQQTHYSVELVKLLVNKTKHLPSSPVQSNLNATEAMEILKQFDKTTNINNVKDGKPA